MFNDRRGTIGLIHSLGGCGGTLMAQCLGVFDDVLLLSECNPLSSDLFDYNLNPYMQLKKWHPQIFAHLKDEFSVEDMKNLKTFRKFIIRLKNILDQQNHNLVIRDYNYIDYFGMPFLSKPPMHSNLLKSLKNKFKLKQVLLVRHPVNQYNSLRSHSILKDVLTPTLFLNGYLKFLDDFAECKIIKYEDMVSHPGESISYLSGYLDLSFSKDFLKNFHNNTAVTGNFKRVGEAKISLSDQKVVEDPWISELKNDKKYFEILNALAYQ